MHRSNRNLSHAHSKGVSASTGKPLSTEMCRAFQAKLLLAQVLGSLESSRAICDCMAALVQGDLGAKRSSDLTHADNLLPLLPSGEIPS